MCGISGFWSKRPRPRQLLEAMNRTLRHRGPDDEAVWISSSGVTDGWTASTGEIGLAQQRLAILDLSPAGRNPMPNDDETLWITYNGEVFNFREIRQDLEAAGFRFRSQTDTEVILKAYEKWGRDCLHRFIGMFAFAIWDSRRRTLFAARDRLGIKPFYYFWNGHELAFASELKALALYPGFEAEVDDEALAQFLRFQYVPSPLSIYEAIRKLPPGHWLELQDARLTIRRYWDPVEIAMQPLRNGSEEEIESEFDALLSQAVRYRMISDVPLGAFLSGGVDSSTVVALMQENASGPVKTFSIGFDEARFDESPYARAVARHLGTEHHEKICTTRDALELLPRMIRQYDEPFGDSSAIPTMLISRFAREHVTVALSGDGGDELFWGYARYFAYHRLTRLLKAPLWMRRAVAAPLRLVPDRRFRRAASVISEDERAGDPYLRFVKALTADEVRRLLGYEGSLPVLYEDARRRVGELRRDSVSVRDLVSYLPDDILTKVDRASMAFSLEARVPLLDHRVVEFALSLPFRLKYRKTSGKYFLRKSLYRRVPRHLIERPKMGFGIPVREWLTGELRDSVEDVLSRESVTRIGLVDPEAARRLVGQRLQGTRGRPEVVWCLYVLHMWAAEVRSRFRTAATASAEPSIAVGL